MSKLIPPGRETFIKLMDSSQAMEAFFYPSIKSEMIAPFRLDHLTSGDDLIYSEFSLELLKLDQVPYYDDSIVSQVLSFLLFLEDNSIIYGDLKMDHIRYDPVTSQIYLIDFGIYNLENLSSGFQTQTYPCLPLDNGDLVLNPKIPKYQTSYLWAIGIFIYMALMIQRTSFNRREYTCLCQNHSRWLTHLNQFQDHPWYSLVRACTDLNNPVQHLAQVIHLAPFSIKMAPGSLDYAPEAPYPDDWSPSYDRYIVPMLIDGIYTSSTIVLSLDLWWRYGYFFKYSPIGAMVIIVFAATFQADLWDLTDMVEDLIQILPWNERKEKGQIKRIKKLFLTEQIRFYQFLGYRLPTSFFTLQIDPTESSLYLASNPLTLEINRCLIASGESIYVSRYVYHYLGNDTNNSWMKPPRYQHRRSKSL